MMWFVPENMAGHDERGPMIRITRFALSALFVSLLAGSVNAQSLADVARQQPAKPKAKAAKVYTNDDIPSVSIKDEPKADAADATLKSGEDKSESEAKEQKKADAATPEEIKKKLQQEWKDKVAAQKKTIADLEHEIGLLEREYKLRAAVFYADAGNRLRDDKKWADEDRRYQEDVKKKRTELQEAQAKLETMRDQARKAGIAGALD